MTARGNVDTDIHALLISRLEMEIEKVDKWCEKNGHFDKNKNWYDCEHPYGVPYHHGRKEVAVELITWVREMKNKELAAQTTSPLINATGKSRRT